MAIQPDFNNIFGDKAYVMPDILNVTAPNKSYSFTIYSLTEFLNNYAFDIKYTTTLFLVKISYFVFLFFLLIGFFTRFSALVSLFLQLLIIQSIHYYQYGVDGFTTFSLFYCFLFPVGQYLSVDKIIFKKNTPLTSIRFTKKYFKLI